CPNLPSTKAVTERASDGERSSHAQEPTNGRSPDSALSSSKRRRLSKRKCFSISCWRRCGHAVRHIPLHTEALRRKRNTRWSPVPGKMRSIVTNLSRDRDHADEWE